MTPENDQYGIPEFEQDLRTLQGPRPSAIVLCAAVQISALAQTFQLDLPWFLFKRAALPQSIFDDLCAEQPYAEQLQYKFDIERPKDQAVVDQLRAELDLGAAQALAWAREQAACLVLADSPRHRAVAARLALPHIGVLALLLEGRRRDRFQLLRPLLDGMGHLVPKDLYARMLQEAQE